MTRYCLTLLGCVKHVHLKIDFIPNVQSKEQGLYKGRPPDVHGTAIFDQICVLNLNLNLKGRSLRAEIKSSATAEL